MQPTIVTGGLLLRAWRVADAEAVVSAWADPEIRRWGRYGARVPERETVREWLEWNRQQWEYGFRAGFAITRADGDEDGDGGELVGSIMVRDYGRNLGHAGETGETGYWIVPRWRGRGVATLALEALSRWAFSPVDEGGLELRRIELKHSVQNVGSCRVAQKARFGHEATMRESFQYADGAWHDEHLHARLSSD